MSWFSNLFGKIPEGDVLPGDAGEGTGGYLSVDAFHGGYGGHGGVGHYGIPDGLPDDISHLDHHTQRSLSKKIFMGNHFASGIINRLLTAEIHSGLTMELYPNERVLGMPEGSMGDFAEEFEAWFTNYADDPKQVDYAGKKTFGELQIAARQEAMVGGDCLVVLRYKNGMPKIQLISGDLVESPIAASPPGLAQGSEIIDGLEFSSSGEEVAYWVRGKGASSGDLSSPVRVPAVGRRSGRTLAFLFKGEEGLLGSVRGAPLLSRVMVALDQISQARSATTTSFKLNAMIAMFIKKDLPLLGTKPITNAAVRRGSEVAGAGTTGGSVVSPNSVGQSYNTAGLLKGTVLETLQAGETPVPYTNDIGATQGGFEKDLIASMSWALQCPPEIMRQEFNKSFSAAQAAILEYRLYLSMRWVIFGGQFCSKIAREWMVGISLSGKITATKLLESWRDPSRRQEFMALTKMEWLGTIKVSADPTKQVKASKAMVDNAWSTNAKESRLLNGSRFDDNVRRIKRENELLVEMRRPLVDEAISTNERKMAPTEAAPEPIDTAPIPSQGATERVAEDQLGGEVPEGGHEGVVDDIHHDNNDDERPLSDEETAVVQQPINITVTSPPVTVANNITTPPGEKGDRGDRGDAGARGNDGNKGDTGKALVIVNGEPGSDGADGEDGLPGLDGKDGVDGESGPRGDMGDVGLTGLNGLPGQDGKDGVDGSNGADGTDAIQDIFNVTVIQPGDTTLVHTTADQGRLAEFMVTCYDSVSNLHKGFTVVSGKQSGGTKDNRMNIAGDDLPLSYNITESSGLFSLSITNNHSNSISVSGTAQII